MYLLKAQGSSNDVLIVDGASDNYFKDESHRKAVVQLLCDRSGPFGADGVYFVSRSPAGTRADYYNSDGTSAEICVNGMRCAGRFAMDVEGTDSAQILSAELKSTVHRAKDLAPDVKAVVVDTPPITFDAGGNFIVAGETSHYDEKIDLLHREMRFTAVLAPNPHLVAISARYQERDLISIGRRVAQYSDAFPRGANVSVVVPLATDRLFVRTYERGAGLTPSCGSGNIASRAVYSKLGYIESDRHVRIYNVGGATESWLTETRQGAVPSILGNATFVYSADFHAPEPAALLAARVEGIAYTTEIIAFDELLNEELKQLKQYEIIDGERR